MNRKWLFPVVALLALSLACQFSGGQPAVPTVPVAAPTQAAVVEVAPATLPAPTAEPPPVEAPTSTEAPTLPAPTAEEPTVEPSPEATATPAGPQPFVETFDEANKPGWNYVFLVGGERNNDVYVDEGLLKFEIKTKETYAYVYNENEIYTDALVTAWIENKGDNDNGMAVTCRMSDKGWYELRISSLSRLSLYRYDQNKKDRRQNPYVELMPLRTLKEIKAGFKENEIAIGCVGNEIHMFVNGVEILNQGEIVTDDLYTEGYAGVGGMSYVSSTYGVNLQFKEMRVDIP